MPLITRNSQNANVKLGTTAQLAGLTFVDGDLASDTTLNKLKLFNGTTLQNVGATSFSSSAVVSQSTTIANYTTPTAAVATSPTSATVEYLVIAGGGGGGSTYNSDRGASGGGAGGYSTASGFPVITQTYTITVGAGGAGGNQSDGVVGNNSIFSSITSLGGGFGAGLFGAGAGGNGGSGGGSRNSGTAGSGTVGQGNAGGVGSISGAGGGGATSSGIAGGANNGGNGGTGTASSITGTSVTRAFGGGGGAFNGGTVGTGGVTGGSGGTGNSPQGQAGVAGTANTGNGGGGSGGFGAVVGGNGLGGQGGSGIVIIKYLTAQITATGGTITTDGSYTIHSFSSSGSFVVTINGESDKAIDDNTATKWTSSSESNPNIYVDMGSALNLCGTAFYFDSTSTTNTEILIQSSPDASVWTTRRTITETNLTDGAYNFYRFNIAGGARYIRFYGNSAGSTVLSIWEIKVLKKTDAEIFNDLGILTITASDTTLGPDGT